MQDEIVPVVDEQDNIIGYKKRKLLTEKDIHRSGALWIENSKGQLFIAQRADSKKSFPGCWGSGASGVVSKGEEYDAAILREAEEEIGLKGIKPMLLGKLRIKEGKINFFAQYFILKSDLDERDLVLNKREVKAVKWIYKNELKKEVEDHPERFTLAFSKAVKAFIR